MRLTRRVAVLERRREGQGPTCPECGGSRRTGVAPQIRVVEHDEPCGPERCPGCGRRLVVTIEFDRAG